MATYQVSFQVSTDEPVEVTGLEVAFEDLLKTAVCPALDVKFQPLSHIVRRVRS